MLFDKRYIKYASTMLIELGNDKRDVYEEVFEKEFLIATQQYYQRESDNLINSYSCIEFLNKSEARWQEEADRVVSFLDFSSKD
jgi:cullin 1|mmetsp:Transcript_35661/g.6424  ORF Transcript_35661/g.6424 Transcript_35661/m.6424 type:complete len:84 (+) Transcript_35661:520-771(+)